MGKSFVEKQDLKDRRHVLSQLFQTFLRTSHKIANQTLTYTVSDTTAIDIISTLWLHHVPQKGSHSTGVFSKKKKIITSSHRCSLAWL